MSDPDAPYYWTPPAAEIWDQGALWALQACGYPPEWLDFEDPYAPAPTRLTANPYRDVGTPE